MSNWRLYNPSPTGRQVGDCAVRALSKALNMDWERAYAELAVMGFTMGDMPSSNAVINAVLKQYGFRKQVIPNTCPDCYTIMDFANDHPVGMYVVGTGNHIVAVENGTIFDSWDCSNEIAIFYWEEEPEEQTEEEKKDGV